MQNKLNPFSDPPAINSARNESPVFNNLQLYEHLQQGNTINFVQARQMGIDRLDFRIAELRKVTTIYSRFIRINSARCMEYSLQPFL